MRVGSPEGSTAGQRENRHQPSPGQGEGSTSGESEALRATESAETGQAGVIRWARRSQKEGLRQEHALSHGVFRSARPDAQNRVRRAAQIAVEAPERGARCDGIPRIPNPGIRTERKPPPPRSSGVRLGGHPPWGRRGGQSRRRGVFRSVRCRAACSAAAAAERSAGRFTTSAGLGICDSARDTHT